MKTYVIINKQKLIANDQLVNEAVLLWKDETTQVESDQYALRINESNESEFRHYIKYSEAQIISTRSSQGRLAELIAEPSQALAFASKVLTDGKNLFKRVHGVRSISIPAGQTGYMELSVPYPTAKFSGAELFGVDHLDTLDFFILDTDTNTYSGAPVEYPNWILNQFGFDVEMPANGKYSNTSNYDADLYYSMIISCAYKNNGNDAKVITGNYWLHEVK